MRQSKRLNSFCSLRWIVTVTTGCALMNAGVFAAGSARVVMVTGDPAPDGNGFFKNSGLSVGGLNDAGQVVFSAQLVGSRNGLNDNSGLFRSDGTTLVQIVRTGQEAPATMSPGATFFLLGNPVLNNAGAVAFSAFLMAPSGGFTALFRGSGTPQSLTQIVRDGQMAPDGNGVFATLSIITPPALNNSGQVAFSTQISSPTNSFQGNGVFRGDGATITQIARSGSDAPENVRFGIPNAGPVLNDAGKVAFGMSLIGGSVFGTGFAVAVGNEDETALYAITGKSTPDGKGTFRLTGPTAPFLNKKDQLAFVASADGLVVLTVRPILLAAAH